ncbi:uncharacterized protein [Miscanthus floridulus]|uniref:uncharacterized protein n=1 Tax=Miscanthus floridulus TaxID=154761 RepID=UPI00345984A1
MTRIPSRKTPFQPHPNRGSVAEEELSPAHITAATAQPSKARCRLVASVAAGTAEAAVDSTPFQPHPSRPPRPLVAGRQQHGRRESALFNFYSFLTVVLLVICTCTYIKMQFPAILNDRTGFRGFFWKAARIGERLSPWVSVGCLAMGISTIFF